MLYDELDNHYVVPRYSVLSVLRERERATQSDNKKRGNVSLNIQRSGVNALATFLAARDLFLDPTILLCANQRHTNEFN